MKGKQKIKIELDKKREKKTPTISKRKYFTLMNDV